MANRFRQILDSVLYAGLKPNAPARPAGKSGRIARLYAKLERFAAGKAPSDPLYLTNRTWKQKLKLAVAIGLPCLVLAGAIGISLGGLIPRTTAPPKEPTPAEIVAKLLPDIDKTVKIDGDSSAEIVEVRVSNSPSPKITGLLRNRSSQPVSVEFALELTDDNGSRLGAVEGRIDKAPAKDTIPFELPIKQANAVFALVRELHTVN